jgi:hypothetical protein
MKVKMKKESKKQIDLRPNLEFPENEIEKELKEKLKLPIKFDIKIS